jgi:transposase
MDEHRDLDTGRTLLERWARSPSLPQRVVLRSRIILLLAEGYSARAVAHSLQVSRNTVDLWRKRFLEGGSAALLRDKPGRGRKRKSHDANRLPAATA